MNPYWLIGVICGTICAFVAYSKGRSAIGWFFLGLFFNIFGLIAVLICSNRKEAEAHRLQMEMENRRLREQLRQEQIKAETFRTHAQRRLDAHDQKLAIDTRADDNVLAGAGPAGLLGTAGGQGASREPPFAQQVASTPAAGWYYALDGQTLGPVQTSQIVQMIQNGAVSGGTLVWIEGMADWLPASRVPEFSNLVQI
ncbi:MAG TPA: DUF4339 domain-containing protein [Tepidisphaeraceae bacterium]|jgi:hypothetical protein|nr:DUF4339 domain-containing protein [Tepidisphaeraceae bacterium]